MTIQVDDQLHAQFKSVCAASGVSMREVIERFMKEFNNTYQKDQND